MIMGFLFQNDPGIVTFHRDSAVCAKYYVCQGEVQHHKTCPGLATNSIFFCFLIVKNHLLARRANQ